jgi:Cu2+-exporting ATPase
MTFAPAKDETRGCPSGLAPAADAGERRAADPAAFVRVDDKGVARLALLVKGARCAGCMRKIEEGLLALPGVEDARLNLSTGRLAVQWREGAASPGRIAKTLTDLGYENAPFDPDAAKNAVDQEGRFLLHCLAVAAFGSMNIMLFSVPIWFGHGEMGEATRTLFHWIGGLIAIPCALYAGRPFFRSALTALHRGRTNMDVPISLGVALAIGISISETLQRGEHAYFDSVLMLLFFLLIGRYLDHRLRERARNAAKELLAMQAVTAQRLEPDGALRAVQASALRPGDRILVSPGERVAVDGWIEDGLSDLDRSLLTGETEPTPARSGDAIQAGVVNLTRALTVRASASAADSTVAELARLMELGEQSRSKAMRLADRAAKLYVPLVHTLALSTFLGWLILPHLLPGLVPDIGARQALLNAVAVLIITCPCALGLAAPAVQVVATGRLFKRGVFVKSGDALERLAQVDAVVLDKTGTLTLGRPRLLNGEAIPQETLMAAASLARVSRHPLSRALVEAAGPGEPARNVQETPGEGLERQGPQGVARLGRRSFAAPQALDAESPGASELWYAAPGQAPVRFLFADALRSDAKATVKALAARRMSVELASGDRPSAVAAAAQEAGIAAFQSGLTPHAKIARLKALRAEGRKPLMIGDGLNDAAPLAAAHASASPGSAVDASQAAADLVIQGHALGPIIEAIDVAREARRRIIENFGLAVIYNMIAVPVAMLGLVTPLIAALAMAGSSLLVTLNALRLQR